MDLNFGAEPEGCIPHLVEQLSLIWLNAERSFAFVGFYMAIDSLIKI
jgi:hypothetical protein